MESGQWREVSIDTVTIGPRFRKDLGDIAALAESIEAVGLLHPIVITTNHALIVGRRRLAAYAHLERSTIPAFVIDLDSVLNAEFDENERRKALNPSERVAIIEALHEHLEGKAKARQRAHGNTAPGRKKNTSVNFTQVSETPPPVRDEAAKAVGWSGPTYAKAKAVVEAAKADPFLQPLVETMDRTGKVTPAWNRLPEDLRQPSGAMTKPKAVPILTIETILSHFDKLFQRCAPSFHTIDEEGVQQLEDLFAYFLQYITAEAQQAPTPDDAPRANLPAVATSMNERLRQLPFTRVQAKNKTATG